ncbi:transcription factor SCREAM2-like isoform X3 [Panicum virgatum]|uniref:transcription factor SCREAM2-like isoform X3 n=1 Tax=Panicum virgatum TaxID=38727 RepID=UPI0019D6110F|nr:transcription factor SCREAM2-like isoform X3 [Panicum virgatum]
MSGKKKKLQLLRSVTKSDAANKTSILVDASKYIKELKDKVEEATAASAADSSSSGSGSAVAATVSVSSVDLDNISNSSSSRRGFRINVSMERSRPGLLVSVLEALEDLGIDVLDADVSFGEDTAFRLEALGSGDGQQQAASGSVDAQKVRQAVLQAIGKCINDGDA